MKIRKSGQRPRERSDAADHRHDSDRIMQFAEEKLEPFIGGEIRTSVLCDRCRDRCRENGCFAENSRNFLQGLKAFAEVKRKRPSDGTVNGTVNMVMGYRPRNILLR
ncbi:MAG: hypothetical protein IJM85_07180 [Clostridia bacterium]|nr:hypothetical protein [Clostridia bacterium]